MSRVDRPIEVCIFHLDIHWVEQTQWHFSIIDNNSTIHNFHLIWFDFDVDVYGNSIELMPNYRVAGNWLENENSAAAQRCKVKWVVYGNQVNSKG